VLSFWVQNDRLQKVCFWVKDLSFRKKGFILGRKRLFPVCNVFLCSSLRGKERLVSHGQTNSSYRVQTCVFFRPARLFSVFKFLPASLEASKGNGNSVGGCRRVLCRLAFENYLPDWWPQIESIWRVQPCYEVFWSYFPIFFSALQINYGIMNGNQPHPLKFTRHRSQIRWKLVFLSQRVTSSRTVPFGYLWPFSRRRFGPWL